MDTRAVLKGVHTLGLNANHAMSRPLMTMLSRGGKFIITPRMPQRDLRAEREQAFKDYVRNVRLRIMFSREDSGRPFDRRYHIPNPTWQPRRASAFVEAQLERLGENLRHMQATLPRHEGFNCTREEREALHNLCHDADTIVKPADKNLGLTLISKEWYIAECERQLSDRSTYGRVHGVSLSGVQEKVLEFIATLEGHIPPTEHKWLTRETRRLIQMPQFYIMPKLHKNPVKGRPIVASHSWCTWPLSKWVANRINTYAASQDTVLTDTNALIALLRGVELREDDDIMLSTADVESLYTSIPIPGALVAVEERLRACGVDESSLRITINAVAYVLRNNFFECNGNVYHQRKGLAMGTPLAPPVANLFLASHEARLMSVVTPPLLYVRYLDDILVVQKLGEAEPEHLLWDGLHTMHPDIKLTRESSPSAVDFLDLQIYRQGKRLLHRVHQKALNKYLYISPRSCHPRHVIEGFVRTELIRYARNSSTELDFVKICHAFSNRLRERGFHPTFLKHLFASVNFKHYAIKRARETPMVFKALYMGRVANLALSRTIKEWYDTTPMDFKVMVPKPVMCHLNGQNIYKKLVRAKVPT
jgi:hypothetical protein